MDTDYSRHGSVFRGHWPARPGPWPLWQQKIFHHKKNLENIVWSPLCEHYLVASENLDPSFEILNTPVIVGYIAMGSLPNPTPPSRSIWKVQKYVMWFIALQCKKMNNYRLILQTC